jgi:hypothetical protein
VDAGFLYGKAGVLGDKIKGTPVKCEQVSCNVAASSAKLQFV